MSAALISLAESYYRDSSHPKAVAENFKTGSDEWVVALFHDILEDTHMTSGMLQSRLAAFGYSHVIKDIIRITRTPDVRYFDYIRSLTGVAKEVKIKDIEHNLSRSETLTTSLNERYQKALQILKGEE